MSSLIELIEQGNVLNLIIIAALLYYVGQFTVASNPRIRQWGYRISLLVFIAYGLFEISQYGISGSEELLSILFRGLIAAGIMLGASWILLSIFAFLYSPIGRIKWSLKDFRQQSQIKKEQKQQLQENKKRSELAQKEWEQNAPEREQQQKVQQQAEQKRINDQHKREEIRLSCQLLYDQSANKLQEQFPRERLVEYFDQYLSDGFPIEIVEQRGKLLKEMIESSLGQKGGGKQKFSSLNEIAAYFQEQKKEIELLNYDEPTRQSFITSLNEQEDRTIREFLSS